SPSPSSCAPEERRIAGRRQCFMERASSPREADRGIHQGHSGIQSHIVYISRSIHDHPAHPRWGCGGGEKIDFLLERLTAFELRTYSVYASRVTANSRRKYEAFTRY